MPMLSKNLEKVSELCAKKPNSDSYYYYNIIIIKREREREKEN